MPKKQPVTFAARLIALREAAGMTKNKLAVAAGIDPTYLGRIEAGKMVPGWYAACAIARALGVPVAEFPQEPAEKMVESGA